MVSALERLKAAEATFEAAAGAHGEDSKEVAEASIALGEAHCDVGNPRQGLLYLGKALLIEDAEARLGATALARANESLAYAYAVLDNLEMDPQEPRALERALEIQEQRSSMQGLPWTLVLLADFAARQGDSKQHAAILRQARDLLQGQPESGRLLDVVASRLRGLTAGKGNQQASEDDAVARFLNMLVTCSAADRALGRRNMNRNIEVLDVLRSIKADLASKNLTDVQKLKRFVEAAEQQHGEKSPHVCWGLAVLAEMQGKVGGLISRRECLQRLLRIQEEDVGFDSIHLVWTLKGLAHVQGQLGNLESRCDFLRRALEIQEEELGSLHSSTTTTRFYLKEVQTELLQRRGHVDAQELPGLFHRRPPTNPKVNRFVGEVVIVDEGSGTGGKGGPDGLGSLAPFQMAAYGGGSCEYPENGGLEVPFYVDIPGVA